MHRAAHAYLQTRVTTTSQGEVLLLLYDGALTYLRTAKERLAANDMAGKGNAISRAMDIVEELSNTLNMDAGGALSQNLLDLYGFCNKRLIQANIKKKAEILDEVIKILSGLRAAFAVIVDLPEAVRAGEQVAASRKARPMEPSTFRPGMSSPGAAAPGAGARRQSVYAGILNSPAPAEAAEADRTVSGTAPEAEDAAGSSPAVRPSGQALYTRMARQL
ncbi:MAG: flagellar export chaperone FliS [Desulfovibrio sp.]|jgi:flagellar protein FliS|nr:flagellar export chaperone FliS [Desulfovibrio sp.]